jgi:autotransporter-associated beta strand protein
VNINGDRAVALSDNVVTGNGLELDWSANINAGLSLTLTAAAGTPSLRLAGSNAYTGATSIGSGVTLYADSTNALGTVAGNTTVAGGGTLVVRGGIVYAAEGLSLSFNTVTGLRSESGNNEWTGIITNPGGSSSTPASVQVVQDTLTVSATLAAFTSSRPFAKDGDGALVYTNAGNFGGLTVRGGVFAAAATTFSPSSALVLNGGVYAPSANFTRALGTAATNFNFGTNGGGFAAYNTAVSVNIGSLTTAVWGAGDGGTANFLPNAAPLILNSTISTAAVTFEDNLDLAAAAATFTGSREIRVLDNTASATDFAVISGAISTSKSGVGLTKTGAGVLVLSGTGTYDGTTAVSAGTLLVNGQLDNQASDVSIAGGARLGGTGTVYRPVTVAGTIAPGVGPGTLTIGDGTTSRNLTLAAGGSAEFEVGSTVAGTDLLAVNGSIDLAAASNRLTLVAVSGGPNGSVASYTILNATGGRTGDFEQVYVGNTAINVATAFDSAVGFVFGSGNYYLAWDSSSGGQLTLNAVPEPGMISVLGLAGAGLLRRRKRVA